MAQTSVYFDAATMQRAQSQAKRLNISLSSHLASLVNSFEDDRAWPDSFFATLGALTEDDIEMPKRPSWDEDSARSAMWE